MPSTRAIAAGRATEQHRADTATRKIGAAGAASFPAVLSSAAIPSQTEPVSPAQGGEPSAASRSDGSAAAVPRSNGQAPSGPAPASIVSLLAEGNQMLDAVPPGGSRAKPANEGPDAVLPRAPEREARASGHDAAASDPAGLLPPGPDRGSRRSESGSLAAPDNRSHHPPIAAGNFIAGVTSADPAQSKKLAGRRTGHSSTLRSPSPPRRDLRRTTYLEPREISNSSPSTRHP